ncbi:MAG TPA: D-alanyl-D-alanine carboxypeptidase family protein [Actinomycetota bacterium]|nr:D-alanyl-D-alanine carboxypeptidase family protein [Actinomycetota bacterium]
MRRLAAWLVFAGLLIAPAGASAQQPAAARPSPPAVVTTSRPAPALGAAAGILVDASDGSILWERNSHARRAVASTTKILTALVVLEQAELDDVVIASARAEAVGANDPLVTELELVQGERMSVQNLLYGLLLPSGSDAAVALAEHVGGSIAGFARLMNERAREAGAAESNFTNADGLDDPAAYSTAYDLAQITRAAMANAQFRRIVATPRFTIPRPGGPPREVVNRNELLGRVPGVNGVKTGNTRNAGRSLVASAQRESEERIAVILGSPDPFAESAALLNFGFAGFQRYEIVGKNRPWGQLTYGDGTTVQLVSRQDVGVLLGANSPPPRMRYRPAQGELVVDVRGGLTVPLEMRCAGTQQVCGRPERRWAPLAALISLFGPVLGALR